MVTQDRLKEVLHYDPITGLFTWKVATARCIKVGEIAGCKHSSGYIHTKIDYKNYRAHRLAWLYVHGYMPENDLDHINQIRDDNRIVNLREVSKQCNARNCGNSKRNVSGVKGVSLSKAMNKWHAYIRAHGKRNHLGFYNDFADAVCARLAAEQCLNWSGCDSSSPAYRWVEGNIQ